MAGFSAVICGGGIAGVEALLRLHHLAGERLDVTLINPDENLVYRPITVLEPFADQAARRYPIARIVEDTGAHWVRDSLAWLDRDRRVVHTSSGAPVGYDAVLLAVGARETASSPHVDLFTGRDGGELYRAVVADIVGRHITKLAFLMPAGPAWPLPLYELALLTAKRAFDSGVTPQLAMIIPGQRPLEAFGPDAGDVLARLLRTAGITLYAGAHAHVSSGRLVLEPSGTVLRPDRIISLPDITGPDVRGIPGFAGDRFLHVDEYCRVLDTDGRIFAAGDATDLPVKQGGVGAQQADVAAAGIAHLAGVGPAPDPLRPKISATLFTGAEPLYLSAYLIGGQGWRGTFHDVPPWAPGEKVVAQELGPYLRTLDTCDQ